MRHPGLDGEEPVALSRDFENELTQYRLDTEEFHSRYEAAVDRVRESLGQDYANRIGGEDVYTGDSFEVHSPGDQQLLIGRFAAAGASDVDRAVGAASDAFDSWRRTSWNERRDIGLKAAETMADRKFDLAALITLENGKNRTEAVADVDEAIDFLRYYAGQLRTENGYALDTGEPVPGEQCATMLRPYGVFGVISPFNFPCAILTGMTAGAILTGNTAVIKPAEATPAIAHAVFDILTDAGVPDGVINLVAGDGETAGAALVEHEDVDGIAFTGSRAVGVGIQRRFLDLGKRGPVIAELGGKNPVIATASADLEKAISGVAYGAFGFSGQKCSATSRVYVDESRFETFVDELTARAESVPDHPPDHRDAVVSPVITEEAIARYRDIIQTSGAIGTVHAGGTLVAAEHLPEGRYVRPTVLTGIPHDHPIAREEQFLPVVTVHPIEDLAEGIELANDSEFGLCAGLFSEDSAEIETWYTRIEAGMTYVNRSKSATTGALVHAQPFGGWKFSGTTGKFAGGPWYLQQFMRQQTRTHVLDS